MSDGEPGKATLLAIFQVVKATRDDLHAFREDHELRLRALERKRTLVAGISGAVASVIVALIAAFLGGCVPAQSASMLSREATVEVEAVGITPYGIAGWSGTGWYIASNERYGVLATAGHVCGGSSISTLYTTSAGETAQVIYDHDVQGTDDVCLMLVPSPGRVLRIGGVPDVGDAVVYTGYPDGVIGTYHGEVSGVDPDGQVLVSIAGYGGSSGAAVLDNTTGDVVGMLVMGDYRFTHHVWLVGTASLYRAQQYARDFLYRLRVDPWATVTATLVQGALDTFPDGD